MCTEHATRLRGAAGGTGAAVGKADRTPVTAADLAVQSFVTHALRRRSAQRIVAEEDSAALEDGVLKAEVTRLFREAIRRHHSGGAGRLESADVVALLEDRGGGDGPRWVLDPIDGTRGFMAGVGPAADERGSQYGIALAEVDELGRARVGVIGLPGFSASFMRRLSGAGVRDGDFHGGIVLAAESGGGAWWAPIEEIGGEGSIGSARWRRCAVDARPASLRDAALVLSDSETWCEVPLSGGGGEPPREVVHVCCGSIVKHCCVALGLANVFVQSPVATGEPLKVWDHAAAVPIVEESGGRMSGLDGRPLDMGTGATFVPPGGAVVASNGTALHDEILQRLARGLAAETEAQAEGRRRRFRDSVSIPNQRQS